MLSCPKLSTVRGTIQGRGCNIESKITGHGNPAGDCLVISRTEVAVQNLHLSPTSLRKTTNALFSLGHCLTGIQIHNLISSL